MTMFPELAGGRLTIDLGELVANWRVLAKKSGRAECGAVVKANAYGCGIEPVVTALFDAGCRTFFAALAEEGARVKRAAPEARCFLLNGLFAGASGESAPGGPAAANAADNSAARFVHDHDLIPVLNSLEEVTQWVQFAQNQGEAPLPCAIQVDTGMNRLGLSASDYQSIINDSSLTKHLAPQLLMTHYACADDRDAVETRQQRDLFIKLAAQSGGLPLSAANSAAILQQAGHEFDLTRPGVALYGGEALNDEANPMQPVVTLEGRIIQIRSVAEGAAVGYGATERMARDSRIAYISVGYADGYHRAASHTGVPQRQIQDAAPARAFYKGHYINGTGRISMDMCAFDVTDIPPGEIRPGDWIELFGKSIPVDDVARAAGTIGYEMLTAMGNRYARIFTKADTKTDTKADTEAES